MIVFTGIMDNKMVADTFHITLELKPRILHAEILGMEANAEYPELYDISIGIKYEGSKYVYVAVEEEYSMMSLTFSSSTPYYAEMRLSKIDLWGQTWVDILVRNPYGTDNIVIEVPATDEAKSIVITGFCSLLSNKNTRIDVYDMQGRFISTVDEIGKVNGCLTKGQMGILKIYEDNSCPKTFKYVAKNNI
jgi:hypothetical protein